jgi:hypothetical protein
VKSAVIPEAGTPSSIPILTKTIIGTFKSRDKLKSHIKVKSSLGLITGYAIRTERGVEVKLHALTSEFETLSAQFYAPVALLSGRKPPGTH